MEAFSTIHDTQLPKAVNLQTLDPSDVEPLVTGDLTIARPRVYRKASGTCLYDFLRTGDIAWLISPRVRSASQMSLDGRPFPWRAVGPLREPVAEYGGLVVIGRCLVDNSKSMLVSGRSPERIDHGHDGEPCLLNSTAGQGMTFHS